MPTELPPADEPRPDRCETCRFFDPADTADYHRLNGMPEDEIATTLVGECRRRAPVREPDGKEENGLWPWTEFGDWCGEWQPKGAERSKASVEDKLRSLITSPDASNVLSHAEIQVMRLRLGLESNITYTRKETARILRSTIGRVRSLESKARAKANRLLKNVP